MGTSDFDLFSFLDEPGRPASLATVTTSGKPALGMMWFAFEDGRFWFHTPDQAGRPVPFLNAARAGRDVAAMVATFDPPDVRQVRVTGPARIEYRDVARIERIYHRYVPTWTPEWAAQTTSEELHLWSLSPERGMAVTFPGLENRPSYRWSTAADLLAH
ncbi:pyridoxamine 5'-phosphate oxidase family protein [Amycolatopsis sp. H20-H5]|uniref:pyridoxamine 5'-phosphate oxidase family protein n=1 Tax=Amycolatopsis sp. H20-H5 TaxID=3046309 RepID=UPI002DB55A19|nr:pyridoxamine 5'-phosphate oxidase family protein [Amycolatopsis sp. H20-H5]MEC3979966.1 pyridoxamine 5'-phosphate oxidase family protein [Amycolatopsis sp. H20-H5]